MSPSLVNQEDDDEDSFGDVDDDELLEAESSSETLKSPAPQEFVDPIIAKAPRMTVNPKATAIAQRILKQIWGFSVFRLKQEQAITRLLNGGSAVVIFPTGGGKSLVYQVPALAFDEVEGKRGGGITLVVSPLIALMKVRCLALSHMSQETDLSSFRCRFRSGPDLLRLGSIQLIPYS